MLFAVFFLKADPSFAAKSKGETLFETNCASCHGKYEGKPTDGPPAAMAALTPRNLAKDTYPNSEKDILDVIAKGKLPKMPPMAHIKAEDAKEIAKYVLSLKKKK